MILNISTSCNELIFADFENPYNGEWINGGDDATRLNDNTYASSEDLTFRLRDNTVSSLITTSSTFDLSDADSVKVSFHAYPRSLERSEDLWFQISNDNGSNYTTVASYANGAEFSNDVPQFIQFTINAPFTSLTKFRFRLDASSDADYVYLDDILIETCINQHSLLADNIYSGCQEDGYTSAVGSSIYNELNPSGIDTLVSSVGFDSIVTTVLTFNPISLFDNIYSGCNGDGFITIIGSNTYNELNPSGMDTFFNSVGCDSIITTSLTFTTPVTNSISYIGCENDGYSVVVGSNTYNESNPSGMDTLLNPVGCDSIITTSLSATLSTVN